MLPRDLRCPPPNGMAWAGAGRQFLIKPSGPSQFIELGEWGDEVASQIVALMVVSAVQAQALVSGPLPTSHHVRSRRAIVIRMQRNYSVRVNPRESRTGELWAFPLMNLVGPPWPAIN